MTQENSSRGRRVRDAKRKTSGLNKITRVLSRIGLALLVAALVLTLGLKLNERHEPRLSAAEQSQLDASTAANALATQANEAGKPRLATTLTTQAQLLYPLSLPSPTSSPSATASSETPVPSSTASPGRTADPQTLASSLFSQVQANVDRAQKTDDGALALRFTQAAASQWLMATSLSEPAKADADTSGAQAGTQALDAKAPLPTATALPEPQSCPHRSDEPILSTLAAQEYQLAYATLLLNISPTKPADAEAIATQRRHVDAGQTLTQYQNETCRVPTQMAPAYQVDRQSASPTDMERTLTDAYLASVGLSTGEDRSMLIQAFFTQLRFYALSQPEIFGDVPALMGAEAMESATASPRASESEQPTPSS